MADAAVDLPQDVVAYLQGVFSDGVSEAASLPPGAFTVDQAWGIAKSRNPKATRPQVYQQLERRVSLGELRKRMVPMRDRSGRRVIEHAFYWIPTPEEIAATAAAQENA